MAAFITFRLQDDDGYPSRYRALMEIMREVARPGMWTPATSFILFLPALGLLQIGQRVKSAINPLTDVALLGVFGATGSQIVIGEADRNVLDALLSKPVRL